MSIALDLDTQGPLVGGDMASVYITDLVPGLGLGPGLVALKGSIKGIIGGLPPTPAQVQTVVLL